MHTGKKLEAQSVDKGRLSCDSDALQDRTARSDSTRVVKVNRRKTNLRKTVFRFFPTSGHTLNYRHFTIFFRILLES